MPRLDNELLPITDKTILDDVELTLECYNLVYRCPDCNEVIYSEACSHTYNYTIITQPTCTSNGERKGICSVCGHTKNEILESGHLIVLENGDSIRMKFDTLPITDKTTLGNVELVLEGYNYVYRCPDCNEVIYSEECTHTYGEHTTTLAPTCTEAGTKERECSVCHYVDSATIEPLGHAIVVGGETTRMSFDTLPIEDKSGLGDVELTVEGYNLVYKCPDCEILIYSEPCTHTYGEYTTTLDPTCTEAGTKERVCSVCHYVDSTTIEPLGHAIVVGGETTRMSFDTLPITDKSVLGEVELTLEGYNYVYKCPDREILIYSEECTHTYGEYTTTLAPTCIETGTKERECSVCHYKDIVELETIPHKYSAIIENNLVFNGYTNVENTYTITSLDNSITILNDSTIKLTFSTNVELEYTLNGEVNTFAGSTLELDVVKDDIIVFNVDTLEFEVEVIKELTETTNLTQDAIFTYDETTKFYYVICLESNEVLMSKYEFPYI